MNNKLELKFLIVALIAVVVSFPISRTMQQRAKALDSVRQENKGLNVQIKSLQKLLQEQKAHDEQIRQQNLELQKKLQAKIKRDNWLASLTFPVGNAPAWKVRDALAYYMDSGLSKTAAAYLVGSLVYESSLNEMATGDGGVALGIAQWHPNRRYDMPSDYHGQLEFVLAEMKRQTPGAYILIMSSPSPEQAAQAIKVFEGYGVEGMRFDYANHIIQKI